MVVVDSIGSQPALHAELTAVPRLMESPDAHGVGLEQLFDDVALGVVEVAEEVVLRQCVGDRHRHGDRGDRRRSIGRRTVL